MRFNNGVLTNIAEIDKNEINKNEIDTDEVEIHISVDLVISIL